MQAYHVTSIHSGQTYRSTAISSSKHTVAPFPLWVVLLKLLIELARRPLLALTLGIISILLLSSIGEAWTAYRIRSQVSVIAQSNAQQQAANQHLQDQLHALLLPATIIHKASILGYTIDPSTDTTTP